MGGSGVWMIVIYMVIIIGGMYFFLLRPNKKKKKQEDSMRNNLQIGDEITTIGGIMGKIVSIKDETDSIVIETGVDRSKVRVKRWSVASCDTVHDD